MPRRRKPRSIHVSGRRWFQCTYGNTYSSSTIYVDGEEVHYNEPEYGYGDYYLQSATEWLEANGYLPGIKKYEWGGMETLSRYCQRKGIQCSYDVADVRRERDL